MTESNGKSWRRKSRGNDAGSIEGLPLQLMIMGIIASLGTAVVVGWVSSIEAPVYVGEVDTNPKEVEVFDEDGNGTYKSIVEELEIKVFDTGGSPIKGAAVLCEGACLDNLHHRLYGVTDADGSVIFNDVSVKIEGDRVASIKVSISGQAISGDYWTEIIVLPS